MKFEVKSVSITQTAAPCVIVPIFDGGKLSSAAEAIDQACQGALRALVKRGDIEGKTGQWTWLPYLPDSKLKAQRVLLAGVGKKAPMKSSEFVSLLQKIGTQLRQYPVAQAALFLDELDVQDRDKHWQGQMIARALRLSLYRFEQMKSKKSPRKTELKHIIIDAADRRHQNALRSGASQGLALAEGMIYAKDLGNLPGNVCTPVYLAGKARELARHHAKLRCKILDEAQMKKLGMGAFLSVTAGTVEPSRMIILEYRGAAKSKAPVVLVGKGITFDSGGISLKPGAGMDEMKFDMCGAASVLGTLHAAVAMKLPLNIVGILAAAENMPSGCATKPGDIVTSMRGQTIEILNPDAEGRLVLCDALTYAARFKPSVVIDIATLTGACVVALGNHAHGLYSNNDALAQDLLEAGTRSEDRAWQMPLWEDYDKQLKSPFADMANIGGPNGGSVTAACFLARFTKHYSWAHLDIAGTAWNKGEAKGSTARPVPMLVEYLLSQC